jgi:hypothetical protein
LDIWEGNYYLTLRNNNKLGVKRWPRCVYGKKHTKAS